MTIDHYEPWVTLVPAGVTKGSALEKLRTELGVAAETPSPPATAPTTCRCCAGRAQRRHGTGPAEVRAAATEVTPPVTEDGAALALARWFP